MLLLVRIALAGTTGSISGTVTDSTGRVIVSAEVLALNAETGVKSSTETNAYGFYSFPALAVGRYTIQIQAQGFSIFEVTWLVLDVNSALRVDAALQVRTATEKVTVSAGAAQVDIQSTQMGELIGGREIVALPLNGRDYTELMALQPGVVPYSTSTIGFFTPGRNGEGTLSISGGRPNSNGFIVNGGNTQEAMENGSAVIPNLDSISEFRILTNNFDAEYGHYSGGVVNVVTKSGTDKFHGDAFEFLRLTALNARNFFNPSSTGPKAAFTQNQFGGTVGGPIQKKKVFYFVDYEGTRQTVGGGSSLTPVPSFADRGGNLADQSQALTGVVTGPAFANVLSHELGYAVNVGEPFYSSGCTVATCVFPNAVIPQSVISPISAALLKHVPMPNVAPSSDFPTGAYTNPGAASNSNYQENKGGLMVDANTVWGMVSAYYHIDSYSQSNPDAFSVGAIGSTATHGQVQLVTLGDTKSFGVSTVNELRLSYMRNAVFGGAPTSAPINPASVGFTTGCNTLGICPLTSSVSLPFIFLNAFGFGGPMGGDDLRENTYQALDNYSKVIGTHSLKFGGIYALSQANTQTTLFTNGYFTFDGSAETGLDFADFLLGAPTQWVQSVQLPLYNRGRYYGLFAQDSWRLRRSLTFNFGLRWDVTTPWWEKYNRTEALVPGLQSVSFPTAPVGWTIPGDGVATTVAPTRYSNVAPRVGLAFSPDPGEGFLRELTGGVGRSSIRASWGLFYTDLENFTSATTIGDAPYGLYWVSPTPPMFATPWVDLYTGNVQGQRFPIPSSLINASPSNPDPNVNWAQFEPISGSPTYYYRNVIPYTESYMLSLQRQFGTDTVLSVSYVGTQGHHLMVIEEANPASPSVCLSVSLPSEVAPGSNVCGPFSETGTFTRATGQVIQARQQLGPNGGTDFGSTGWFRTLGNSSYNAFEISLRHTSGRLTLLGAYTYSKSMDDSSTPTDQVYPFNPGLSRALSSFDLIHNFVVSYSYELPLDKVFRPTKLSRGWILAGITHLATGLPVTILETDDRSLIGATGPGGPTGPQDEPNYTPGTLLLNTNPRKGGTYFNTYLFSVEKLGHFGNSSRRFFHGPGTNNWDLALLKNVQIKESKTLQFRAEFFNAFNHAQFNNPDGVINHSTFGVVTSAQPARIGQLAVKFMF
jgi:hypothetical protein